MNQFTKFAGGWVVIGQIGELGGVLDYGNASWMLNRVPSCSAMARRKPVDYSFHLRHQTTTCLTSSSFKAFNKVKKKAFNKVFSMVYIIFADSSLNVFVKYWLMLCLKSLIQSRQWIRYLCYLSINVACCLS